MIANYPEKILTRDKMCEYFDNKKIKKVSYLSTATLCYVMTVIGVINVFTGETFVSS